jgi:hypothetical protein
MLCLATRVRAPIPPIISLLAHPEEPEEPEQPRYPEEHPTLARHERELIRQLGVRLDGKRPEGFFGFSRIAPGKTREKPGQAALHEWP